MDGETAWLGVGVDDPRGEVGVFMDDRSRIGFSVGSKQEFGVYSLINDSSARAKKSQVFYVLVTW